VGDALFLFDIDGTLMRKAGPDHAEALEDAVRAVTGHDVTVRGIPVAGMLDRDILAAMMRAAGMKLSEVRAAMPAVIEKAQMLYSRRCPDLRRRVCPGVRTLLPKLQRNGAVTGLVTGNLSRIGWKKVERAGLRPYFRFGAFAEMGRTRAELARLARRRAVAEGWVSRATPAALVGDHPNDIVAARANGLFSIAVATGVVPKHELARHRPDLLLDDLRGLDLRWIGG
jgi:phosphoglycolate phosphatase-like HAD superfamily hydrolase